ncbi:serine/threonine protein kinase [Labilithrix luteola]|uniref:Serine/threonine protein kinase n=1 Tax=Labilithrix luteola TaxID=1391654 RepID=A0A0K1Q8E5_9BACT|nr:serine/threonine protein kinase [Labilithrix luteola]
MHPRRARDPYFVRMFLEEARIASRVKHPNVVSTFDFVADESEVFLVMEYVNGESLEKIMGGLPRPMPAPVAVSIMCGVLEGLHAAHEATSDAGEPLLVVHRDVSPHNVLIGSDGVARVFDFGIAKAIDSAEDTREGVVKGKVAYMAPEQVRGAIDRRSDVYAAGVMLWELLVSRRRHAGEANDQLFLKLARNELTAPAPPSTLVADLPRAIDDVVARATSPDPNARFATAREMALALEAAMLPSPAREVAHWLRDVANVRLSQLSAIERQIAGDDSVVLSRPPTLMPGPMVAPPTTLPSLVSSTMPVATGPSSVFPPFEPARRNWTMPAAFIAFTAALLLVGLRTWPRDSEPAAAPAAAGPAVVTAQASAASSVVAPAESASTSVVDGSAPAKGNDLRPAWAPKHVVASPPPAPKPAAPPPIAPAPPPTAKATAAPAKAGCDNPFVIGPDGIRQIKPECL